MGEANNPEELADCPGLSIASETQPGVLYRVGERVGEGTMGVAFTATRTGPEGESPVVIKVTKPSFLGLVGDAAPMMILKEAVALGRLNEQVPPTPFVVRLLDSGRVEVAGPREPVNVPWNAVEYVHGGALGTTLYDRVEKSLELTGFGFDMTRASQALSCIADGLDAIHKVEVIHRDISPGNVLCCGSNDTEIFKIADFGIARPIGLGQTFGDATLGTPGYAAPEQLFPSSEKQVAAATDVFSFAGVIYFLLTGEDYFSAEGPVEAIVQAKDAARRSVADARGLCPELRAREDVVSVIDDALARATRLEPEARPHSAGELANLILPHLEEAPLSRAPSRRLQSLVDLGKRVQTSAFDWVVRQRPMEGFIARSVAWDSDGSCLVLGTHGLWFFNGTDWRPAPVYGLHVEGLRFVMRQAAGRWILGGEDGRLTSYGADGLDSLTQPGRNTSFERAAGDPADLGVVVGARAGDSPRLYSVCGGRWLKPASLPKASNVSDLARIADELWVVAGRTVAGTGFVATYNPLMWESRKLVVPEVRAYVGCAGNPVLGLGLAVGAEGKAVLLRGEDCDVSTLEPALSLSVAAVDSLGGCWTGAAGHLWYRPHTPGASWSEVWHDSEFKAPFVSLLAQEGRVVGVTVDGAVIEGRAKTPGLESFSGHVA